MSYSFIRSYSFNLTLRVAMLVVLTTALVMISGRLLLRRQSLHTVELMQIVEGNELQGLLLKHGEPPADQIKRIIENEADSDVVLYFIQIRDARGDVVFSSANLGESFMPPLPEGEKRATMYVNGVGELMVTQYHAGSYIIEIGSALAPVSHVLEDYTEVSVFIIVVAALLSIGLGYWFSRATLAPIRNIERTARRIGADNLSERIPVPPGRDELAALTQLLNETFNRLESAFVHVRRFSADASHELKTPLSLIRLNAEKLRSRLEDGSENEAILSDILEEAEHMTRVIESLLFIAKTEGGAVSIERTPHEMSEFISDFEEDAKVLAEDNEVVFKVGRNDTGVAGIQPHLMRQLLMNLTNNAIHASPQGGVIILDSIRTARGWRLEMRDEGPGLPAEMIEKIFERFVRYQGATSFRESRGYGLGLAICRSIMELHRGGIQAENRNDHSGLRVIVEW